VEEATGPEAELKKAVADGEIERALELVKELAGTGELPAYKAIIRYALSGADYDLEKQAGAVLAKSKDPAVRALILEDLGASKNYKTRIVLLALAARMAADDAAAMEAVHGALKDPQRQVVFAALSWIRELKREESLAVLVTELEEREKKPLDRIYHDVLKSLQKMTGADFTAASDWKNLVSARRQGIKTAARKESATVVYTRPKPKFFGMDLRSDRVLFIIDTSGSMRRRDPLLEPEVPEKDPDVGKTVVVKKGASTKAPPPPEDPELPINRERMTRVRTELMNAVRLLPETSRFGILAFSHRLEWWGSGRSLQNATGENKASALGWIRALRADGATRTDLALDEGLKLFDVDTIFLLTDGAPQHAEGEAEVSRIPIDPILADTKTLNRFLRCRIHTVSFAQIRDDDMRRFVTQIAAENDGECKFLP
jgi:hypothetical protein